MASKRMNNERGITRAHSMNHVIGYQRLPKSTSRTSSYLLVFNKKEAKIYNLKNMQNDDFFDWQDEDSATLRKENKRLQQALDDVKSNIFII